MQWWAKPTLLICALQLKSCGREDSTHIVCSMCHCMNTRQKQNPQSIQVIPIVKSSCIFWQGHILSTAWHHALMLSFDPSLKSSLYQSSEDYDHMGLKKKLTWECYRYLHYETLLSFTCFDQTLGTIPVQCCSGAISQAGMQDLVLMNIRRNTRHSKCIMWTQLQDSYGTLNSEHTKEKCH